jgi:hypothetical protein
MAAVALAGSVLGRTRRVEVGTAVSVLSAWHPVEMAATARRTGIDHLICMVGGSGDPAAVREDIARLGAEVLPRLPGRDGSRTALH